MKVILVGYPGSQCIVPVNKYLLNKYMPGFDVYYINHAGLISEWGKYLSGWLECLTDEYIIFSLDDFLINSPIDAEVYEQSLKELGGEVVCIKLCHCTPEEHLLYPVTAQYTIWNREYLMWFLSMVNRPWDFEFNGLELFRKKVLLRPCLKYFTNSSISGRWHGIRLDGLSNEDLKYIKENKLIIA